MRKLTTLLFIFMAERGSLVVALEPIPIPYSIQKKIFHFVSFFLFPPKKNNFFLKEEKQIKHVPLWSETQPFLHPPATVPPPRFPAPAVPPPRPPPYPPLLRKQAHQCHVQHAAAGIALSSAAGGIRRRANFF